MLRTALTVLLLSVFLIITGCDPENDDNGLQIDLTTVSGAIQALVDCWNEADYNAYEKIFHNNFVFYFDQIDILDGAPSSWGRHSELDAAGVIFSEADIIEVMMSLPDDFVEPEEDLFSPPMLEYLITVEINGIVHTGTACAWFKLERNDGEWSFLEWVDVYTIFLGDCRTWGGIKYQLGT